jgi:hypothetical protein
VNKNRGFPSQIRQFSSGISFSIIIENTGDKCQLWVTSLAGHVRINLDGLVKRPAPPPFQKLH